MNKTGKQYSKLTCENCNYKFNCYGLVGGQAICNRCYDLWYAHKQLNEEHEKLKIEIVHLKAVIKSLEQDLKDYGKDEKNELNKLIKDYNKLIKENEDLKKQLYVVDHETGEISDRTILSTYETPKFKEWRCENRNTRILAEGSDDVSDLDLGRYIKMLEKLIENKDLIDWFKNLVYDNLCDICNPHDVCEADELTDDMIELIMKDIHSRFMDIRSLC